MKILDVASFASLVRDLGFERFMQLLIERLDADFRRWDAFSLSPRHVTHLPFGVLELMPCSDGRYYTFKYVNGHPRNTRHGKLSVAAVGMLVDVEDGYPLLFCEMTLLTALRTAATAALAAKYLARPDSRRLAIIGTGAQSEFVVRALGMVLPIEAVAYYDLDPRAMAKFRANMGAHVGALHAAPSLADALGGNDVLVTATAAKSRQALIRPEQLYPGLHIHAMGGDCAGKTELAAAVVEQAKVVVEFLPQSLLEGEVQQCSERVVHAELHDIVSGDKPGRESA